MNQPKNYINVSNIDTEKLLKAEEKTALKRKLYQTEFDENVINEILLDLLAIKYGKVGNHNINWKRYLSDGIRLAKAILILQQGDIKMTISSTKYSESTTLPQTFVDTNSILEQLRDTFNNLEYKRSYTIEEAKIHISEEYIDDYVYWWYGGGQSFKKWKDAGKFERFYAKEDEEMLKAFIRDHYDDWHVIAWHEYDLKEFIKQSEELIKNYLCGKNVRKPKDLTPIAIAKVFVRHKEKLGRKDFSIIYECMKILGLIKEEEDKTRNKDAREKYVKHYCEESTEYGIYVGLPYGFRRKFINGDI